MRHNRSVPPCPVTPALYYLDPGVAASWLGDAFGFSVPLRIANHLVQTRLGEGCLTIAKGDAVPNYPCVIQVRINDALGHCERARLAGARILSEPKDHAYGERQYAEDFHGPRWDFTESMEDMNQRVGAARP